MTHEEHEEIESGISVIKHAQKVMRGAYINLRHIEELKEVIGLIEGMKIKILELEKELANAQNLHPK